MHCTDYPILSQFSCAGLCVPAMFPATASTSEILPLMQQPACPSTASHRKEGSHCMNFLLPQPSLAFSKFLFSLHLLLRGMCRQKVPPANSEAILFSYPRKTISVFYLSLATGTNFNFLLQSIQLCACTEQPGMPLGWRLEYDITGFFIALCLHLLPSAVLPSYKPLPASSVAALQNQRGRLLPDISL